MQTMDGQMMSGDSRFGMSARLVSPWDFRFLSGQESSDDEKTAVDILRLFAEVCGDDEERELPPQPSIGVGYTDGAGGDGVEVVSGIQVGETSEEMEIPVGDGVQKGGAEAVVNYPVNYANGGGRMSEELVLRSLTVLMGWS